MPPPHRPQERRFAVFSLAVGPDGREVVGGANDGCLYVYDREAQRRVLRVGGASGGGGGQWGHRGRGQWGRGAAVTWGGGPKVAL